MYIANISRSKRRNRDNIIIAEDFGSPLSTLDRISTQKICKDIVDLNNTADQIDLTHIHRRFQPITPQYTSFS